MPTSHSVAATRPVLRSLVVINPVGLLVGGMFLMGLLLMPLAVLKAAAGNWQRATFAGLLGLSLLLSTTRKVIRRNHSMLLTSNRDVLSLEPIGRSLAQGLPAETIPVASITAYTYWLRLLKYRAFAQYHLRLELTDGRVLHLADRPGAHPDDPTGTVRLDAVARWLARRGKTAPTKRPLFYLTRTARTLLWGSWVATATGAGLLGLGYSAGILPLCLGAAYWASYYLGRGAAEITP